MCETGQAGRSNLNHIAAMLSGYRAEQKCGLPCAAVQCGVGFCHWYSYDNK